MKRYYTKTLSILAILIFFSIASHAVAKQQTQADSLNTRDMDLTGATVTHHQDLDLLVFQIKVKGKAGQTIPVPKGELNGAPVLGYVFPTSLSSEDVGFNKVDGIVALAVTSHPDFDDTPLWDENNDFDYANDGYVFHSHWVVLVNDKRVSGGLAARALDKNDASVRVPGTFPDMPIYLDSPGFAIVTKGEYIKVLVPAQRMNFRTDFSFDAVSAYMQVDTTGEKPMLGVYQVYDILSGDLSLPYKTKTK